jgi:exopolysaccharide biosynthesis predicted pyruvyltransferase EpsI
MLLPYSYFDSMFIPLQSKKVYFVDGLGNVGDDLINDATHQLFEHYDINLIDFDSSDTVIFGGGGNFGVKISRDQRYSFYEKVRQSALPKKLIIFPQSIYSTYNKTTEELPEFLSILYVRDKKSLELMPNSVLAPDMVLGYNYKGEMLEPTEKVGVFLREDIEARFGKNYISKGDPATILPNRSVQNYFNLAMQHEHIYTDRLHFAVSSLIVGRKVTLLPNGYFKNRMLWETWLKDLGCLWADTPPTAKRYFISLPPIVSFAKEKIEKKLGFKK